MHQIINNVSKTEYFQCKLQKYRLVQYQARAFLGQQQYIKCLDVLNAQSTQTLPYQNSFYKSDTLKGIGRCYMELGKLELATAYFKEAFDTISKAKYRYEKLLYHEILYYLGITYYKMSNLKEAIHYLKESKKWIEFLLLRSHYGDLLQGLSKIYISNENYKEAIKTNQKAGHYFQFINDMEGMSSLIEIGVELAHKTRDYDLFTTWISEHINTVLKCPWAFTDELVAVAKNLDVKELLSQEKNQSS